MTPGRPQTEEYGSLKGIMLSNEAVTERESRLVVGEVCSHDGAKQLESCGMRLQRRKGVDASE